MKRDIRKNMIQRRNELPKDAIEELSNKITRNLFNLIDFKDLQNVMLYNQIKNEVMTDEIISFCFKNNIGVVLPKVVKEKREIIPCQISSLAQLKEGEYGILEPFEFEIIDKEKIDVVIVPGVAFSRDGYRLGYGAGYYDKFLKDYDGKKIGICYSFQLLDNVYQEKHDIRMDYIVTESEIIALK